MLGTGSRHSAPPSCRAASKPLACRSRRSCKPEQLLDDPHLVATGGLAEIRLTDGERAGQPVKATLFPFTLDGQRPGVRLNPPKRGEHTREVLAAIGIAAREIDALIEAHAVA